MCHCCSSRVTPRSELPIFSTRPKTLTEAQGWRVRSASKEFIAKLTSIQCEYGGCNRTFKSGRPQGRGMSPGDNLPVMAYCGHYICTSHKRKNKDKKRTYRCPNGPAPKAHQVNLFVHDEVLDDVYTAISKRGFKCFGCNEWHSQGNTILCSQYAKDNDKSTDFLCVWCFNKGIYANIKFERNERPALQVDAGKKLVSLDRTQDKAGWALNQCCICRLSLHNPRDENRTMIAHLSDCDHIAHKKCAAPWLWFKCGFCPDSRRYFWWNMSTVTKEISVQTKHYFEGIESNERRDFFFCMGKGCFQAHPNTNRTERYGDFCVWCNVEAAHEQNKQNRTDAIRNLP